MDTTSSRTRRDTRLNPAGTRRARAGTRLYGADGLAGRADWIERYAPLVKRIACHMMARLPANVELGDLVQAGMAGLIDAVANYEETQGAQFETYAVQRVRGAILDELRRNDWLPRSVRRNMRQIEGAITVLEQQSGRPPRESEIAAHLNVSLEEFQRRLQDARGHQIVYVEDLANPENEGASGPDAADGRAGILDSLLDEEFRRRVASAIEALPEREKTVMSLYYEQELNLREIGEVLNVTESRVCQIHSQAIARLRARLAKL